MAMPSQQRRMSIRPILAYSWAVKFYDVDNFCHDFSLCQPIICHIKHIQLQLKHRKNNIIIINLCIGSDRIASHRRSEGDFRRMLSLPFSLYITDKMRQFHFYIQHRSWNHSLCRIDLYELYGRIQCTQCTQLSHSNQNTKWSTIQSIATFIVLECAFIHIDYVKFAIATFVRYFVWQN